jgi:hypothetical protein
MLEMNSQLTRLSYAPAHHEKENIRVLFATRKLLKEIMSNLWSDYLVV